MPTQTQRAPISSDLILIAIKTSDDEVTNPKTHTNNSSHQSTTSKTEVRDAHNSPDETTYNKSKDKHE